MEAHDAFKPVHSPLGASSMERWQNCPGSVALLKLLTLPPSDEPDYRELGTAAHEAIAKCNREGLDAWEVIGETHNGIVVDDDMARAIQVFLDDCRTPHGRIDMEARDRAVLHSYTEFGISSPIHDLFYGTLDYAQVRGTKAKLKDYKHGEGVVVEVEDNPQFLYYAYGLLELHPEVEEIEISVVQPRGFHPEGPVRRWTVDAEYVCDWANSTLVEAMNRVEYDDTLTPGEWCRFCPAKLVCPVLTSLFGAATKANPKEIINLSDESLGRSYALAATARSYLKALEEEVYRRRTLGVDVPQSKLVQKKAERVFKPEATDIFTVKFGDEAFVPATLKSPAQMEKIGVLAKTMVHEWAYTPVTGLTVAPLTDKRPAVKIQTTTEAFPNAAELAKADP